MLTQPVSTLILTSFFLIILIGLIQNEISGAQFNITGEIFHIIIHLNNPSDPCGYRVVI